MSETIEIVTLIENDPITGAKYGTQKMALTEITEKRNKSIKRYNQAKARRQNMLTNSQTIQK